MLMSMIQQQQQRAVGAVDVVQSVVVGVDAVVPKSVDAVVPKSVVKKQCCAKTKSGEQQRCRNSAREGFPTCCTHKDTEVSYSESEQTSTKCGRATKKGSACNNPDNKDGLGCHLHRNADKVAK